MQKRIRRRYAAERRFRLIGLGAVLLSAGFLAFLLITMAMNGARGFTPDRASARRSTCARAALLLDRRAARRRRRRAGARRRRFRGHRAARGRRAIWRARRPPASRRPAWLVVRDAVKADPEPADAGPRLCGCRPTAASTTPPRATARRTPMRAIARSTRPAARRIGFNTDLPDRRRRDRSDRRRHLGRVQGLAADDARHACCSPSRSACSRRSISRNMRRGTAGPT